MERTPPRRRDFRSGKPATGGTRAAALPAERTIFGLHAVEAALSNPKRTAKHAYLTENAAAKLGPLIAARGVAVTSLHPHDFDALVGAGAVHQGAVLDAEPLAQPGLDEFLDALPPGKPAALAMLDQVTDPHNVGAVLRSAAAFGIAALIVQDRHSPPVTGTLAKAASGALEHVPLIATVNLARALERLKDSDFVCVGFDSEAAQRFDAAAASMPRAVFVFGAEDKGLRRLIREGCDALYALSAPGKIKSLNISNAAAIVFYEAAKANRGG
ncbi:MAG: 23S rRNA (guanosine(2251)-2'-O)-methyltransferase RlmB [Rhodomicrobium sp.]